MGIIQLEKSDKIILPINSERNFRTKGALFTKIDP